MPRRMNLIAAVFYLKCVDVLDRNVGGCFFRLPDSLCLLIGQ